MDIQQIAYKPWSECDSEERKIQLTILEKCYGIKYGVADFWYFLSWCRIISTPTFENPGGLIPFEILDHNKELIDAFLSRRLIAVMKSRQIWISYTTAAYVLWFAMAHRGANNMLFSKGEKEAFELLAKCYRLHRHLPPILKLKQKPDSAEEMGFPSRESSIRAFPSTQTAGISFTGSIIVSDEHVEHEYDKENYLSAKPTIDSVGGQFISIFTPNKLKLDKLAFSLWRNAPDNGFHPIFFPYNVLPDRDEKWYEDKKINLTADELAGLTPELYMESNYPRSITEALRAPQTTLAFEVRVLDEMMSGVKAPVEVKDVDPKIVKIYQPYHIGESYIAGTDTAHGMGKDFAVTTIMNVKTGSIVADILDNTLSPEELALHSVSMLRLYHNPLWFPESNGLGGVTILKAQELGYKNFGYQDDRRTKIGFNMDGYQTPAGLRGTRTDLFAHLMQAINSHQIQIFNPEGIKQFYGIIRNIEKEGRIEAGKGKHDDYPVAVGICWLKKDEVKSGEPMKPIRTLDFEPEESDVIKRWINA